MPKTVRSARPAFVNLGELKWYVGAGVPATDSVSTLYLVRSMQKCGTWRKSSIKSGGKSILKNLNRLFRSTLYSGRAKAWLALDRHSG